MFGSPLKATLIIALLFGLGAGSALFVLTRPEKVEQSVEIETDIVEEEGIPCWLTVRSAHPMSPVRIYHGKEELELDNLSEREAEGELEAGKEVTLKLIVKWADDAPETAVLVSIEPEGQATQEVTLWAQRRLTQEITFTLEDIDEN